MLSHLNFLQDVCCLAHASGLLLLCGQNLRQLRPLQLDEHFSRRHRAQRLDELALALLAGRSRHVQLLGDLGALLNDGLDGLLQLCASLGQNAQLLIQRCKIAALVARSEDGLAHDDGRLGIGSQTRLLLEREQIREHIGQRAGLRGGEDNAAERKKEGICTQEHISNSNGAQKQKR